MQEHIEKADVLIEALSYIQEFRGEVIVVKFGGSAMEDRAHHDSILADVAFMAAVGMRPVIVHGGGKAISRRMTDRGMDPMFLKGRRVTDAETIRIVEEVMCTEVNPGIVGTLQRLGARARAVAGTTMFSVTRKIEEDRETGERLDWGFVGRPEGVDTSPVLACFQDDAIPVVTPLGTGPDGHTHNINADEAAAAAAQALTARKLAFLSDVPGLLADPGDPDSILSTLRVSEVERLISQRVIDGGMLPKIQSGVDALHAGVRKIHIIDGRLSHSLLLEIFTDKGVGTEIIQ
jgi:acetylglutamate kinase